MIEARQTTVQTEVSLFLIFTELCSVRHRVKSKEHSVGLQLISLVMVCNTNPLTIAARRSVLAIYLV